jgi:filamentous hemagglutinin
MMNELQSSITKQLTETGVNLTVAKGAAQAVALTTAATLGAIAGGGTVQGAAAGGSVDANNRMLHHNEKEMIAKKANGDKVAVERLTKAACFEIKCWAQFPEGSPLYIQSYVSPAEAAGLKQEIAWVNQQKNNGDFIYTPFEKFTDGIAATTGLSSVNGQGTLNGQFISNPSQTFRSNDCVTAECAAGMSPFRGNNPPDYVSGQVSFYILNGGLAINLHNGDLFGSIGFGRSYPNYSTKPGVSITAGALIGKNSAEATSGFLGGAGTQGSAFVPVPFAPWFGMGGGINHSYGGSSAIEGGVSIPPGYAVSPAGYSSLLKKGDGK